MRPRSRPAPHAEAAQRSQARGAAARSGGRTARRRTPPADRKVEVVPLEQRAQARARITRRSDRSSRGAALAVTRSVDKTRAGYHEARESIRGRSVWRDAGRSEPRVTDRDPRGRGCVGCEHGGRGPAHRPSSLDALAEPLRRGARPSQSLRRRSRWARLVRRRPARAVAGGSGDRDHGRGRARPGARRLRRGAHRRRVEAPADGGAGGGRRGSRPLRHRGHRRHPARDRSRSSRPRRPPHARLGTGDDRQGARRPGAAANRPRRRRHPRAAGWPRAVFPPLRPEPPAARPLSEPGPHGGAAHGAGVPRAGRSSPAARGPMSRRCAPGCGSSATSAETRRLSTGRSTTPRRWRR